MEAVGDSLTCGICFEAFPEGFLLEGLTGSRAKRASSSMVMKTRLSRIEDWEKLAKEARFQPSNMAALCPLSLRQLERFFALQFKTTPARWARQLRCRIAAQLILQGWSNKCVAAELHFGNESHLCHEFRRFYGKSPQQFAPCYRS